MGAIWPRTCTLVPRGRAPGAPNGRVDAPWKRSPGPDRDIRREGQHPKAIATIVFAHDRAVIDSGQISDQRVLGLARHHRDILDVLHAR